MEKEEGKTKEGLNEKTQSSLAETNPFLSLAPGWRGSSWTGGSEESGKLLFPYWKLSEFAVESLRIECLALSTASGNDLALRDEGAGVHTHITASQGQWLLVIFL